MENTKYIYTFPGVGMQEKRVVYVGESGNKAPTTAADAGRAAAEATAGQPETPEQAKSRVAKEQADAKAAAAIWEKVLSLPASTANAAAQTEATFKNIQEEKRNPKAGSKTEITTVDKIVAKAPAKPAKEKMPDVAKSTVKTGPAKILNQVDTTVGTGTIKVSRPGEPKPAEAKMAQHELKGNFGGSKVSWEGIKPYDMHAEVIINQANSGKIPADGKEHAQPLVMVRNPDGSMRALTYTVTVTNGPGGVKNVLIKAESTQMSR